MIVINFDPEKRLEEAHENLAAVESGRGGKERLRFSFPSQQDNLVLKQKSCHYDTFLPTTY